MYRCAQVRTHSSYHCEILPCFHPLDSAFLMDPPLFWVHSGTLYMAKKELVKLPWESDTQSPRAMRM